MDVVNHELLSRLLDEHGAALVLYAQQWCNVPEDVVQDAFVRLMRQRPAPDNVTGWLYRVVRNEAVSSYRNQSRRARHEGRAVLAKPAWFQATGDDPIDADIAVTALESLPMEHREVIVLRLWSGLTFDEIAAIIGKPISTTHRWYQTGLESLREILREPCPSSTRKP